MGSMAGLSLGVRVPQKVGQPAAQRQHSSGPSSLTEVAVDSYSCSSWCQSQNSGNGRIIGTAPFCTGFCRECTGTCKQADNMNDYGSSCYLGDKVCCCDRKRCWISKSDFPVLSTW